MSLANTPRPNWLTFDCYGTLIQWDEGLLAAVERILSKQGGTTVDAAMLIHTYDKHEHCLEQTVPYKSFRTVAGEGLRLAMEQLGLAYRPDDIDILTSSISRMPPFPESVQALGALKAESFKLCIISNTDDDVIAGNIKQLGGYIDRVITAQQAQAYKPSHVIFGTHTELSAPKRMSWCISARAHTSTGHTISSGKI
jgi:2-haloacid dehalogenase